MPVDDRKTLGFLWEHFYDQVSCNHGEKRKHAFKVKIGEYWDILVFNRFLESEDPLHKTASKQHKIWKIYTQE